MSDAIKPMLAHSKTPDLTKLTYPLLVQPKFDGIRAMVVDGVLLSRTAKPIRNAEIQAWFAARPQLEGLDGELLVGSPTANDAMQRTSEFVMSASKTGAEWAYYVFDKWDEPGAYTSRLNAANRILGDIELWDRLRNVQTPLARTPEVVSEWESLFVQQGYEGAILRDPRAPYKHGRSGSKGPLLKVKRFSDSEAEVIGVNELMRNGNEATKDAFGRTERSTAKAGLIPGGTLGNLRCRTPEGVEFEIGTGFTQGQRDMYWDIHTQPDNGGARPIIGRLAKYKHFEVGVKTAPRFPVFLGFRDRDDV